MQGKIITLHEDREFMPWTMEVVLDKPTCTICEGAYDSFNAFQLHTGAPVCDACVVTYTQGEQNA